MPEPAADRTGTHVRAFARGLAVIRAFDGDAPQLTLSEVARATGLTRAAARRFLLTLVDLGYVTADGRHFRLTPRVLELGYSYLSSTGLTELAQPHLDRLSAQVGESCSVSVLDDGEIVYVARVAASRIMRVSIAIGTRLPAWATSMGRVLLGGLGDDELRARLEASDRTAFTERTRTGVQELLAVVAQARDDGFALVEGELEAGLRSVAVPIHDASGTPVAAMNISAHVTRVTREHVLDQHLPALFATVGALEDDLHRTQAANGGAPLAR